MKLKKENLIFRFATEGDAEEILGIYKPYIENTTITFEYEVPQLRNLGKELGRLWRNIPILFVRMMEKLLDMPMHIGFGAELLINGMWSFQFIQMEIMREMELGENCIKF